MAIEWSFNLPFDDVKRDLETRAPAVLVKAMEHVRSVVTPKVPVETGALAGSGGITATGAISDGVLASAELLYPGPYALYQHEGVYFRRPNHYGKPLTHTHGESFFLVRPMVSEAPVVFRLIQKELFG